jgi:hypothetical protein
MEIVWSYPLQQRHRHTGASRPTVNRARQGRRHRPFHRFDSTLKKFHSPRCDDGSATRAVAFDRARAAGVHGSNIRCVARRVMPLCRSHRAAHRRRWRVLLSWSGSWWLTCAALALRVRQCQPPRCRLSQTYTTPRMVAVGPESEALHCVRAEVLKYAVSLEVFAMSVVRPVRGLLWLLGTHGSPAAPVRGSASRAPTIALREWLRMRLCPPLHPIPSINPVATRVLTALLACRAVILNSNLLTGTIPASLSNLSMLTYVARVDDDAVTVSSDATVLRADGDQQAAAAQELALWHHS